MPCFPRREYVSKPLFYTWTAAYPCKPQDNILIHHLCEKVPTQKKPRNFVQQNKEAIANYRQDFLKRVVVKEDKMGDGFKLRAKAVVVIDVK